MKFQSAELYTFYELFKITENCFNIFGNTLKHFIDQWHQNRTSFKTFELENKYILEYYIRKNYQF